ncbi:MAG: metallophosphoesterase, partial [Rhodospirillaceae bacterium]
MSVPIINTILHLSDFHYSKRKIREQEIVIDALVKDLETICIGHRKPDLVVFTGDLVRAAGSDCHLEAYDFFISRVSSATGCSDERIFIVPGNHDADRGVVEANSSLHEQWRKQSSDLDSINKLFEEGVLDSVIKQKFSNYSDLEKFLGTGSQIYENVFAKVYYLEALNIDVVGINTAVLSSTGTKKLGQDERLLGVAEYAIRDALKQLKEGSFKIFAGHHPLDMLSQSSSKYLRSVLQEYADVYLFGHMHDPVSSHIVGFEGDLFSDQAGAVFTERRDPHIGYSLITLERSKKYFEAHLRAYFSDRNVFDAALGVVDSGKFYSSQEAREFWRTVANPIDETQFRKHLGTTCLKELQADPEHIGHKAKPVHELFVCPPMLRKIIEDPSDEDSPSDTDKPVGIEEILNGEDNLIIYAAPEFGRSTLLLELQYRMLCESKELKIARSPIKIDFVDIKTNSNALLRTIRGRLLGGDSEYSLEALLNLGLVCLMFDDVAFGDPKRMSILREFVTLYPKARYIFSSLKTSVAPYGTHVVPEMPIHFAFIELCTLRRKEMRALVQKFGTDSNVEKML